MTREQLADLIGDSLDSTATDLRAANYVIHLYSELMIMLAKDIKHLTAENTRLKQELENRQII